MKAALSAGFAATLFLQPVGSFAQSLPAPIATTVPAQAVPQDTPILNVPPGWAAEPAALAMNGFTMLTIWKAPPPAATGGNIGLGFTVATPGVSIANLVPVIDATYTKLFGLGNPVASHAERLCSGTADGWYFENKVTFGALNLISEQSMFIGPSDIFEATYTRPSSEKEDPAARRALDSLCVKAPVLSRA
jgi:hypothetical protein